MRAFLGEQLRSIQPENTIEEGGVTINVSGPLSDVFTQVLSHALKKDEPVVSQESFTDPVVLAQQFADEVKNRRKGKQAPINIYAFNRNSLDESVIVKAADMLAGSRNPREFIVISDYTRNDAHKDVVALEETMENIVTALGGHYVNTPGKMQLALSQWS